MANRVLQAKRLKIIKARRARPKPLRASNWSNRTYPSKEVLGEYSRRSHELERPMGFWDLMKTKKKPFVPPPRSEEVRAAQAKAAMDDKRLIEIICEPDFLGRVQQMNKIELIRGQRRNVTLHFRGNEWIVVEETSLYIRYSYPYQSYKQVMKFWDKDEDILWHENILFKSS
jgi:hypothetical protein